MKIRVRKAPIPPIQNFLDKFYGATQDERQTMLNQFSWTYEKADLQHWAPLLNFFDDYIKKIVERDDVKLVGEAVKENQTKGPFPTDYLAGILHVTSVLLDNCHNKNVYSSSEYFADLLSCPPKVVDALLTVVMAYTKKSSNTTKAFVGSVEFMRRLTVMCNKWGGDEIGANMVACTQEKGTAESQQDFSKAATFKFEFTPSASDSQTKLRPQIIRVNVNASMEDFQLLTQVCEKHKIPGSMRFEILHRIRCAREMPSHEGRCMLVSRRILAFMAFMQSTPSSLSLDQLFETQEHLPSEILGLIDANKDVPESIVAAAMRALAIQIQSRPRNAQVIGQIAQSPSGLWASLTRNTVSQLTDPKPCSPNTLAFAEALLILLSALGQVTPGATVLNGLGLLPALLPIISNSDHDYPRVESQACRAIEVYLGSNHARIAQYIELKGFEIIVERLNRETLGKSHESESEEFVSVPTRNLIKFLIRIASDKRFQPQGAHRELEENLKVFYTCLKCIFQNFRRFGTYLYNMASSTVTGTLHHNPLEYPRLKEVGLPQVIISSIKEGVKLSYEAIINVPSMIGALSLHANGIELVKSSNVIDSIVEILTQKQYTKYLTGEALYSLGGALDELVRHQPSYKEDVANVLIKSIKIVREQAKICDRKNEETPSLDENEGPETMEIDGAKSPEIEAEPSKPKSDDIGPVSEEDQASVSEKLPRTIKAMEMALGNQQLLECLVEKGIVEILLSLYDLKISTRPGDVATFHTILATMRLFLANKPDLIAKPIAESLSKRLEKAKEQALVYSKGVGDMNASECEACVQYIHQTDIFLVLVAGLVRNSAKLIAELSPEKNSTTNLVGDLERLVLKQLTFSQDWKMAHTARKAVQRAKEDEDTYEATVMDAWYKDNGLGLSDAVRRVFCNMVKDETEEDMEETSQESEKDCIGLELLKEQVVVDKPKEKSKSKREEAYDSLTQILNTCRNYYCQIAKYVHNHNMRRRDLEHMTPELALATALVCINLRKSITDANDLWPGVLEGLPDTAMKDALSTNNAIHYFNLVVEGLLNILIDQKRGTCHSLNLNYLAACGGIDALMTNCKKIALLGVKLKTNTPLHELRDRLQISFDVDSIHLAMMRGLTMGCLENLLHLIDFVLAKGGDIKRSPGANALLIYSVPGVSGKSQYDDPGQFLTSIQEKIMAALNPLLEDTQVLSKLYYLSAKMVPILTQLAQGAHSSSRFSQDGIFGPGRNDPHAAAITQIVDMGFPRSQARDALIAVRYGIDHQSVDAAVAHIIANSSAEDVPEMGAEKFDPPEDFFFTSKKNDQPEASSSNATGFQEAERMKPDGVKLVDAALKMFIEPNLNDYIKDLISVVTGKDECSHKAEVIQLVKNEFETYANRVLDAEMPTKSDKSSSILVDKELDDSRLYNLASLICMLISGISTSKDSSHIILATDLYQIGCVDIALRLLEVWIAKADQIPDIQALPLWAPSIIIMLEHLAVIQPLLKDPQGLKETKKAPVGKSEAKEDEPEKETNVPVSDKKEKEKDTAKEDENKEAKEKQKEEDLVEGVRDTIRSMYSVGGLLSEDEQRRSLLICIHSLQRFQKPEARKKTLTHSTADAVRAILQLLARLTKSFPVAQQAVSAQLPQLLLSIPSECVAAEHSAHICAIIRHLIEDPVTLQSAMEAEIFSALHKRGSTQGIQAGTYPLPLTNFLTVMSDVVGRDPIVFFEALRATCSVKLQGTRALIGVKPRETSSSKKDEGPQTEETGDKAKAGESGEGVVKKTPLLARKSGLDTPRSKDAKGQLPKSSLKSGRRSVHPNFVEVVDVLVDRVMSYKNASIPGEHDTKEDAKTPSEAKKEEQKKEEGSGMIELPMEDSNAEGTQEEDDRPEAKVGGDTDPNYHRKKLDTVGYELLNQYICLKMLAELTLMYNPTVSLILRRDSESKGKPSTPYAKTPRKEGKHTGILIRHILTHHIAPEIQPDWHLKELALSGSGLLLALVIRSSEGRKRVIHCTAELLSKGNDSSTATQNIPESTNHPHQVQILAELVSGLTTVNPLKPLGTPPGQAFAETMHCLSKSNVKDALLQHLRTYSLTDSQVTVISALLKPIEFLTRPSVQGALNGKHDTSLQKDTEKSKEGAEAGTAQTDTRQAEPQRQERGLESRPSQSESAAGPEAMRLAQEAMQRQQGGNSRGFDGTNFAEMMDLMHYNPDQMVQLIGNSAQYAPIRIEDGRDANGDQDESMSEGHGDEYDSEDDDEDDEDDDHDDGDADDGVMDGDMDDGEDMSEDYDSEDSHPEDYDDHEEAEADGVGMDMDGQMEIEIEAQVMEGEEGEEYEETSDEEIIRLPAVDGGDMQDVLARDLVLGHMRGAAANEEAFLGPPRPRLAQIQEDALRSEEERLQEEMQQYEDEDQDEEDDEGDDDGEDEPDDEFHTAFNVEEFQDDADLDIEFGGRGLRGRGFPQNVAWARDPSQIQNLLETIIGRPGTRHFIEAIHEPHLARPLAGRFGDPARNIARHAFLDRPRTEAIIQVEQRGGVHGRMPVTVRGMMDQAAAAEMEAFQEELAQMPRFVGSPGRRAQRPPYQRHDYSMYPLAGGPHACGANQRPDGLLSDCLRLLRPHTGQQSSTSGMRRSTAYSWSDNGLPYTSNATARPAQLAGTIERQIADALRESEPEQAQTGANPSNTSAQAGLQNIPPFDDDPELLANAAEGLAALIHTNPNDIALPETQPLENVPNSGDQNQDVSMAEGTSDVSMRSMRSNEDASTVPRGDTQQAIPETEPTQNPPQIQTALQETEQPSQEGGTAEAIPQAQAQAEAQANDAEMTEAIPSGGQGNENNVASEVPRMNWEDMEIDVNQPIHPSFIENLPAEMRDQVLADQQRDQALQPPAGAQEGEQAANPGANEDSDEDPIDPTFIEALPPDIQAEVIQNHERERERRRAERLASQRAAEAAVGPSADETAELAAAIATFPPEVRRDVLMTTDMAILARIGVGEEAEALRRERMTTFDSHMNRVQQMFQNQSRLRQDNANAPSTNSIMHVLSNNAQNPQDPLTIFNGLKYDEDSANNITAPVSTEDIQALVRILSMHTQMQNGGLQTLFHNLTQYKQSRRDLIRLLVLMTAPDASRTPLVQAVSREAENFGVNTLKAFCETLLKLVGSFVMGNVAMDLCYVRIPWPAQQDPLGKRTASTAVEEPSLWILLKNLGNEKYKSSDVLLLPMLNVIERILDHIDAQDGKNPRKRAKISPLETLPENEEGPLGEGMLGRDTQANEPSAQDAQTTNPETPSEAKQDLPGPSSSSSKESLLPDPPDPDLAMDAFQRIPESYLEHLINLLGLRKMQAAASLRVFSIIYQLAKREPRLSEPLIRILRHRLDRSGQEAESELGKLANGDLQTYAAQSGKSLGYTLHAIEKLRGVAEAETAWQKEEGLRPQFSRLESLWDNLSSIMAYVEKKIRQVPSQSPQTAAISPEASQIQPLVEAFFSMSVARAEKKPLPDASILRSTSQELGILRPEGPSLSTNLSGCLSPALSKELPPEQREALEAHLPMIRFAERHRFLINVYLKHRPQLLESSLAALLKYPRLIDFDAKREYFRGRMKTIQRTEGAHRGLRLRVRRDHLLDDSFRQMHAKSPAEIKAKMHVEFRHEEGVDMGGLTKEWYQLVAKAVFTPDAGLFIPMPTGSATYQPSPNSVIHNDEPGTNHLDYFKFAGRIVGKALFENQYIDAHFTRSLYKHMLDQPLTYKDLEGVDLEMYKSLGFVLENNVEQFLDEVFAEEVDYFGHTKTVELKPGGLDIKLTEANKHEYVTLKAQSHMTTKIADQLKSFLEGFWDIIPKDLAKIFNDKELELMISGLPEIDVEDMKANCITQNFAPGSRVIHWFWEVISELENQDLALLVQFITGTSKVPLGGFKNLQGAYGLQKLTIQMIHGMPNRLPSAHTCFNTLDLPEYENKELLKSRLLTAIREGSEGFAFA